MAAGQPSLRAPTAAAMPEGRGGIPGGDAGLWAAARLAGLVPHRSAPRLLDEPATSLPSGGIVRGGLPVAPPRERREIPGGGKGSPRPARRVVPSQVMEGVHAGGDVWQYLLQVEHGTFVTVVDLDRTMYEVRAPSPGPSPSSEQVRQRPAILLGGDAGVTPFVDREAEIASLTRWYDDPGRISVMLVFGAGGQGKTRLIRRFADILGERDEPPQVWQAFSLTEAFVRGMAGDDRSADSGSEAPAGILLLIDEADGWPRRKLLKLVRDVAAWQCGRVRVLLTSRAAGMWWTGLRAELDLAEVTWRLRRLEPLGPADLRELASQAGRSLARALGRPAPPPPLPREVWDQIAASPPLSVELMVLARLCASAAGQPEPAQWQAAVEVMLEKELRYWARLYGMGADEDPYRILLRPALMARAVYLATLTGPARPSASARSRAVSRRAVRLTPRSRSLTDRVLNRAAAASSSWVIPESARICRSNPAKAPAGCPVTIHPFFPGPPSPASPFLVHALARMTKSPATRLRRVLRIAIPGRNR